jgi:hypothetical protein
MIRSMNWLQLLILGVLIFGIGNGTAQDTTVDDLRILMDTLFPGTTAITIEGAIATPNNPVCLDAIFFNVSPRNRIPQDFVVPDDRGPVRHPLLANVLVTDSDNPAVVFPAEIMVTLIEPDTDLESVLPVIGGVTEMTGPRAEVQLTVQRGESFADRQVFLFNPVGNVLFALQANEFAVERRVAFDFIVENTSGQSVHVIGAIHNIGIPWYVTYERLREGEDSFAILSGIAYTVTDTNTITASETYVGSAPHYRVHLETTAVLSHESSDSRVPVTVLYPLKLWSVVRC